jgi:hypothetical protein
MPTTPSWQPFYNFRLLIAPPHPEKNRIVHLAHLAFDLRGEALLL